MSTTIVDAVSDEPVAAQLRPRPLALLRRAWSSPSGKIGLVLIVSIAALAILGPFVAPSSPTETVTTPFQGVSADHWFGTDFLGRDAFSRFLAGGRSILLLATGATVLTYLIGVPVGLLIGFRRRWLDFVTVGFIDILISFPPLIFALIMFALTGPQTWVVVAAIAATAAPRVVRVVRSVTIEIVTLEYVESAIARGESTSALLRRELLPNLWTPIVADFGIRLTGAFLLASALGYLGFGLTPPTPNWGVMLSENRLGLTFAPLTVLAPAFAIALFSVGVNLFSDAMARALGRSVLARSV
jgi:peptide/nickel transport system permease protein